MLYLPFLRLFKPLSALSLLIISLTVHAQEPVWDGNKVVLVKEKIDDGVFAYFDSNASKFEPKGLPLATSGGFVVGEKGVLMIDTMLNERLYNQAMNFIRETAQKPVIYAVNTSYHGDHSYGNMYLPEDTKIIQHEVTQQYIKSHFDKDIEFMIQNFGSGRGIEDIKPTDADILLPAGGKLSVDLGGRKVDVIDFGFAQTGGDLFVWEPNSKTLWTGNPIITVKPSLPWLLDGHLLETLSTLEAVYDFLPDEARIVPGHGMIMSKQDLVWHLDYLRLVKEGVQQAIEDGLTLAETVKKVTLPEFKGYALHGWVHPVLNVPAAYRDLSKKNN